MIHKVVKLPINCWSCKALQGAAKGEVGDKLLTFNYLRAYLCVCVVTTKRAFVALGRYSAYPATKQHPKTKTVPHAKSAGTVRRELLGVPDVMLKGHS